MVMMKEESSAPRHARPSRVIRSAFVWVVAAGLVAACGGGGGGGGSATGDGSATGTSTSVSPSVPACVATLEGCLTQSAYRQRTSQIASSYRADAYFRGRNQWELGLINADEGYAHLALSRGSTVKPGSGVTVGVIDSGIDTGHPAFANKRVAEVFTGGATDERVDCTPQDNVRDGLGSPCYSHGTAVASVLAADRTGIAHNPHGVAWGADLVMFAVPLGAGGTTYTPVSLSLLATLDSGAAALFQRAIDWRDGARAIDFVNVSVGYDGLITGYTATGLRANFGSAIAALAQANRNRADRIVFVMAGGNANGRECTVSQSWCRDHDGDSNTPKIVDADELELWAGLPALIPELRGLVLSAVAVDRNGDIASFSTRCGIAKNWCLAAPGEDIRTIFPGNNGANYIPAISGTSFAVPMVTGSLAVMKHRFRNQMANVDLASRLLRTANRTGKYANSDIYGQGLLDLGAALSPVGALGFRTGTRVEGGGSTVQHTRLQGGRALGDGLVQSLAGREVAAFDELGAPFWMGLSSFVSIPKMPPVRARVREFMALEAPVKRALAAPPPPFYQNRLQVGLMRMPKGAEGGHLAFAPYAPGIRLTERNGLSATAFSTAGIAGLTSASGVAVSWRPQDARVGLRTGLLAEHETLLGTSGKGAFGELLANSAFVGVEGDVTMDDWLLSGNMEVGMVAPDIGGGMVRYMSLLTTSAFSLEATRWFTRDDALRLSVSQPLRVESGRAMLALPVGRTKSGDILREPVTSGLVPTGRQIEVAAHWFQSSVMGSELRLGARWTYQPNHRADADPALTLLAGWRYAF